MPQGSFGTSESAPLREGGKEKGVGAWFRRLFQRGAAKIKLEGSTLQELSNHVKSDDDDPLVQAVIFGVDDTADYENRVAQLLGAPDDEDITASPHVVLLHNDERSDVEVDEADSNEQFRNKYWTGKVTTLAVDTAKSVALSAVAGHAAPIVGMLESANETREANRIIAELDRINDLCAGNDSMKTILAWIRGKVKARLVKSGAGAAGMSSLVSAAALAKGAKKLMDGKKGKHRHLVAVYLHENAKKYHPGVATESARADFAYRVLMALADKDTKMIGSALHEKMGWVIIADALKS
jgi:hypothetical protein